VVNLNSDGMKWLTTPIYTLLQYIQKIPTEKSNILELSYAFAGFRNIAQSVN
jgi:hypothetical protein